MDGGSFSNRRVIASQNDKPLLNLVASFQRIEEGLHHQAAMPQIPLPEDLPDHSEFIESCTQSLPHAARLLVGRFSPIEFRTVSLMPFLQTVPNEAEAAVRFRLAAPVDVRSEEHTSELQSLMRISYAVFCLK